MSLDLPAPAPARRIALVDLARGAALVAMGVFHFAWDLSFLGFIVTDIAAEPGWRLFSHAIAATFLVLAGLSLGLGHGRGVRIAPFWRRVGVIALAALAVTLGTWLFVPDSFVRFGILHCIALGSVLLLPLLRGPWWLPLLLAVPVAAGPALLASPEMAGLQDAMTGSPLFALWQHAGLSTLPPRAVDFVPIFPWLACMKAGLGAGLWLVASGREAALARIAAPRWLAPLGRAGRWSLPIYLIHQPVLIGALTALAWLAPGLTSALQQRAEAGFRRDCIMECRMQRSAETCLAGCSCVIEGLRRDPAQFRFTVVEGRSSPASDAAIMDAARLCFRPAPSN